MRAIETTTRFRRDYKREKKGRLGKQLDGLLETVTDLLVSDVVLPQRYRDHPLTGD